MNLGEIQDVVKIETVEVARGCPEGCMHCGAYPAFTRADLRMSELSPEELRKNIDRLIEGTKGKLIDFFNNFVTTDVNVEPLRGDIFPFFAQLVNELSKGKSQVICVSHGIRAGKREDAMKERLVEIVKLMSEGVIPKFILTIDKMRSRGGLSEDRTIDSYVKTLEILRPMIAEGRVTFSIQGEDEGPRSRVEACRMFQKVLKAIDLSWEEKKGIRYDKGRLYAKTGRAEDLLINGGDCTVIPDKEFVRDELYTGHVYRAKIDRHGNTWVQYNEPGRSYNTQVDLKAWTKVYTGGNEIREPYSFPKEEINWKEQIGADEDIFKVWPLSCIEEQDHPYILASIYQRLGNKNSIAGIRIPENKGKPRPVLFKDIKSLVIKWLMPKRFLYVPGVDDYFEMEKTATERFIFQKSPYGGLIKSLRERGAFIPDNLRKRNHYAGEAAALACLLEEEYNLDYIRQKMVQEPGWENFDLSSTNLAA